MIDSREQFKSFFDHVKGMLIYFTICNYDMTKKRFANERAYEAEAEESMKAEREKTKQSLYGFVA